MSATDRFSITKPFSQIPAPSENVLLVVIAAAFLILHIAVGVILIGTSEPVATTTQQEMKTSHYD
jgi:hypothetical protein